MIKNEELNSYIGKPIWDNVSKKWRILEGYKRFNDKYWLAFTDDSYWRETNMDELNIYINQVGEATPDSTEPESVPDKIQEGME
jgi:hypothetical protein